MSSPPTTSRKKALDTLILGLKTQDMWDKFDLLYLLAGHDQQATRINIVYPGRFDLTTSGTLTFTQDRGWTGDGSASRLQTGFTPSTNAVKFTQNNASMGVWSLTSGQGAAADMGVGSTVNVFLRCRNASDQAVANINDTSNLTVSNTDGSGLFIAQRRASNDRRIFRNSVDLTGANAIASTGLSSAALWFCGANSASFSARRQILGWVGSSFSGKEAALGALFTTYFTTLGTI